jgi:dienelactone hydrolase
MSMQWSRSRTSFSPAISVFALLAFCSTAAEPAPAQETRVVVPSDGWELIGDLVLPETTGRLPVVIMLNKADGDRRVYTDLANYLAEYGIASLRIDLPGHGDSTNLGEFVPYQRSPDPLIWDAERNIDDIVEFVREDDRLDAVRVAIVGASYSGEEMAEAGRLYGYVQAYVALSPGSFSEESIAGIDASRVPWLFVTSRDERHLQEIRARVAAESETVEQIIVPGTEHASRLLDDYPDLSPRIAVWLANRL